jgi:hypothetical protein
VYVEIGAEPDADPDDRSQWPDEPVLSASDAAGVDAADAGEHPRRRFVATRGDGHLARHLPWMWSADPDHDPVSFDVMQTNAVIGVAGWLPARVLELRDQWQPCATVVDNFSAAATLIPAIEEMQVEVLATNGADLARACSGFYAAVHEDQLRHQGSTMLTRSVLGGKKRDLLDGWAWDRKDTSSDITQLVAVTLALHGLNVNGRTPETEVWGMFT